MTRTPYAIGLPYAVEAKRNFQEDLIFIGLKLDVEVHLKHGQSAKTIAIKDNTCDSAWLEQEGRPIYLLQKGPATITARQGLVQGWFMEAIYLIDLKNVGIIGTSPPNTASS